MQGPNMPKYGFEVLIFLFSIKDMCRIDIYLNAKETQLFLKW